MVTTIKLIRHCNSRGNAEGFFQGQIDTDITEMGKIQLDLIAERFKNERLDAVYTSDLIRAHKTAVAINKYHDLPVMLTKDLREICVGEWEGLNWKVINEKYPDESLIWRENISKFCAPGGERMSDFYDRIISCIKKIACENQGKTVAAVTHGAAVRALVSWGLGKGIERMNELDFFDNTCINTITVDEQGNPNVISINDCDHLPDSMRKHWNFKIV